MEYPAKVAQLYWVLSVIFFIPAAFLIGMNWSIVRYNSRTTENYVSWVPIFGGLFGALSVWFFPLGHLNWLWWVPFLLDFGSFIGMSMTAHSYWQDWREQAKNTGN